MHGKPIQAIAIGKTLLTRYTANTVTISSSDNISLVGVDTIDQVVVNGILKYESVATAIIPAIHNQIGVDLTIK